MNHSILVSKMERSCLLALSSAEDTHVSILIISSDVICVDFIFPDKRTGKFFFPWTADGVAFRSGIVIIMVILIRHLNREYKNFIRTSCRSFSADNIFETSFRNEFHSPTISTRCCFIEKESYTRVVNILRD